MEFSGSYTLAADNALQTRVPYIQFPGSSLTMFIVPPFRLLFNICNILL